MSDARLLKVGDVLYGKNYSGINGRFVIERVTKTQAISGNLRFRIETVWNSTMAKSIGDDSSWGSTSYYLATPKLDEEYYIMKAISMIKNCKYSELTTDQLRQIISVIKHNQTVQP